MELQCVTPVGPGTEKALDENHRNLNKDTWKFYILPFQVFHPSKVLLNNNSNIPQSWEN